MFTNYTYIVTNNKVIALSSFAGKTVKGIAKCHPNDTFNEEYGKRLAAARCNEKVARKRASRADNRLKEAANLWLVAKHELTEANKYRDDALARYSAAVHDLETCRQEIQPHDI